MTDAPTASPTLPPSLVELSSSCFVGGVDAAADVLAKRAGDGGGGYVCLCNVHVLTSALHDIRVRAVLSGAAIRFPDGEPVAWLQRRVGLSQARRVGGPDLFSRVLDRGRQLGLRHFFVGSTDENLDRLRRMLVERYPGAEIVGLHAPPYAGELEVEDAMIQEIRATRAQLVWVGLGAPKQELWMARAAPSLPATTLVGVGAAFDFLAGTKRRAPAWMQRSGLEWLFRLASEPRRLASRYVRSNSEFMARTVWELGRGRRGTGA